MTRYALRCAGVALALGASLSLSALGFADTAAPADTAAGQEVAVAEKSAAADEAAMAEEKAASDQPTAASQNRTIAVAEGLSAEDAAAVAEGKTVRIIDQYFDNFADAVEVANQNGGGTVLLLADTVATNDPQKTATIGFRTSIIVKSEGDVPLTVYRAPGQTGPLLAMTDGTVSLKNVVFDGAGEGVAAPAITISDQAVVKFGKGLTVCNNASDGSASGKLAASAVSVSGKDASLTLKEGCAVENNAGSGPVEAAVYNDGATVVNEGAAFAGNTAEAGENPDYAGTGKLKGEEI